MAFKYHSIDGKKVFQKPKKKYVRHPDKVTQMFKRTGYIKKPTRPVTPSSRKPIDQHIKRIPRRVIIDWEHFEKLCAIMCTEEEILGFLKCSKLTLLDNIKEHYGINPETGQLHTYKTVFQMFSANGKISLRRAQMNNAVNKNSTMMQMWLGQQYLNQSQKATDKPKGEGEGATDERQVEFDVREKMYIEAMNSSTSSTVERSCDTCASSDFCQENGSTRVHCSTNGYLMWAMKKGS